MAESALGMWLAPLPLTLSCPPSAPPVMSHWASLNPHSAPTLTSLALLVLLCLFLSTSLKAQASELFSGLAVHSWQLVSKRPAAPSLCQEPQAHILHPGAASGMMLMVLGSPSP